MPKRSRLLVLLVIFLAVASRSLTASAAEPLPWAQDKPPGPALSPQDAIKRMVVPEGFSVELVAAEPDIVNPVAMTFDERGRIWITESFEYPRHDAGPGRDVIKVLESTKGDGKFDKITTFADGLNIPSGIAVGHGGVWVADSPDILFLQDTKGTGKADKREVVVTGFGRYDTHEVPNNLTWGPDGDLYGLNGVFNEAHIKQGDRDLRFTCALYRIDPRTRKFDLFCQGTSNPWGLAWDAEGSAFVSACVIDHLWHLTETGYYHRQGGPYPPFTWELGSIVNFRHQKAAYCGLVYLDSDAFPPAYRDKLVMGNIHGNCLNVDQLHRNGSTYRATPAPDLLTANDVWFMPVVQRIGPDGCLYILDWYDRYHCYQDASRDPAGVDRKYGRLYRLRYKNTPPAGLFDLAKETDEQLVERLKSGNIYFRQTARRVLAERGEAKSAPSRPMLEKLVLDKSAPHKARLQALWALIGSGSLDLDFQIQLLSNADPSIRAWGVRATGNFNRLDWRFAPKIFELAADPSPDVKLQVAIAAGKLDGPNPETLLLDVLANAGDDPLIPAIVWQNLQPRLEAHAAAVVDRIAKDAALRKSPGLSALMPRLVERILANSKSDPHPIALLFETLLTSDASSNVAAKNALALLARKIQTREIAGKQLNDLRTMLEPSLLSIVVPKTADGVRNPFRLDVALLMVSFGDPKPAVLRAVREVFSSASYADNRRIEALGALISARAPDLLETVAAILENPAKSSAGLRASVLASLGHSDDPRVAETVLAAYGKLDPDLQPKAIELLTQRAVWAKSLLTAIGEKKIPASALNVNQVQRLLASHDKELTALVLAKWGSVRTERNPKREQVARQTKELLLKNHGDPMRGWAVFKKICAQCHRIYGEGQDVGPDITSNGRASFDQLLSNVLDPSLVIGAGYQARIVQTTGGRALTGLTVEDSPQRIVLKLQGGKLETIPRGEVESSTISKLSLMPEGLENQLSRQELIDLFQFLLLDKPPTDPSARRLPGAPR
ncbi:MAG TPA: PVC-type heme-binding CxxCH protein [Pirellulales bacterium]|jgi:putative heme-binding domain-containing protein|nr:PVC-type heme-binding CxxCH protein [Pirellulales bacterium]